MKRMVLASAIGIATVTASISFWLSQTDSSVDTAKSISNPQAAPALTQELPSTSQNQNSGLTAEQQALLDNPQTLELANRLDFEEELHTFFAKAKSLSSKERAAEAAMLEQRLAEYQRRGQVSAAESLMVRIAMTKLTIEDEAAQKRALQGLIDRQNAAAQARKEEWLAKPKPEFEAYKQQEKQIVKEVMAMAKVPSGMTRNEYLRQRLQEARVAAHKNGDAPQ
ncbi:hypothetical protein [Marinobacter algicola]|uniref:Lipase modulator n=1 Tax=Marinobacter algicola DG893 TaxID=443152 RepID=A6F366_9GAMM|nr:hypothetical protein [Marinobacter algicola]EDM46794.1 hypothetical protein MDG893_08980 [Marinobacter algicola DG893]